MLAAFRKKIRVILQRSLVLAVVGAVCVLSYSYVDLEFCFRVLSQNSLTHMCNKYRNNEYSGSLCEELCVNAESFRDFKCPRNEMKTTLFTAKRNGDVYAVKLARHIKDDLGWTDSSGTQVYPQLENFHRLVKMHIMLTYNVSLDDNMVRALVNQEIDKDNHEQMFNFWRLFRDNNFMLSKLFDEESAFPTVLGSCGPYYATEHLTALQPDQSLLQYISFDWQRRLKVALGVMEYIVRLDEMKPEPLKMCQMKIDMFGLTADQRIKYQSAEHVQVESQVDKRLSSGARCEQDADCNWHSCMGKCDPEKKICNGIQQNSNLQIFCGSVLRGGGLFPGLLTSAGTPKGLLKLLADCISPPKAANRHLQDRPNAPNSELTLRLYNEMKRLQKSSSTNNG